MPSTKKAITGKSQRALRIGSRTQKANRRHHACSDVIHRKSKSSAAPRGQGANASKPRSPPVKFMSRYARLPICCRVASGSPVPRICAGELRTPGEDPPEGCQSDRCQSQTDEPPGSPRPAAGTAHAARRAVPLRLGSTRGPPSAALSAAIRSTSPGSAHATAHRSGSRDGRENPEHQQRRAAAPGETPMATCQDSENSIPVRDARPVPSTLDA